MKYSERDDVQQGRGAQAAEGPDRAGAKAGQRQWDAVVAGHICLDIIPDLSGTSQKKLAALLRPGQLVQAGAVTLATGGAVSNTGLSLHKLGIRTRLMGKIGDDLLGKVVQQVIADHSPDLANGMVVDASVDTSYTIILNPPDMDRVFLHCPGANDTFGAGDVRDAVVGSARLFHFGYPTLMRRMFEDAGEQTVEMFRQVKALGVTTSLDVSLPDPSSPAGQADWINILQSVIPYVDIFMPNIEESLYMLRRDTYVALCQSAAGGSILPMITPDMVSDLSDQLLAMGAKIIGFKLGDRGLYVRTAGESQLAALGAACPVAPGTWANKEYWAPCFKVQVVGTTGAGDATVAGFLSALLRGLSLEEAVTAAVAIGACNVEAADALGGIRSWEETLLRIAGGWARHPMTLAAPDWRFDAATHLWRRESP